MEARRNSTKIFGILNLTPDSFSDGSINNLNIDESLTKAMALYMHGADVLDIGAESTRPGAKQVSAEEEIERLIPFLLQFKKNISWPVSIDTRKAKVAQEVLGYNIEYINDVGGLQHDPDMAKVIGKYSDTTKVVVMHSFGGIPPEPCALIPEDYYGAAGLFEHMKEFFAKSIEIAERHGIVKDRLVLDPGIGFGKNVNHSLEIIGHIAKLREIFGTEVLIGASRKSFLKEITGKDDLAKLEAATSVYNTLAIQQGADIIRVHNVLYHRDVVKTAEALKPFISGIIPISGADIKSDITAEKPRSEVKEKIADAETKKAKEEIIKKEAVKEAIETVAEEAPAQTAIVDDPFANVTISSFKHIHESSTGIPKIGRIKRTSDGDIDLDSVRL